MSKYFSNKPEITKQIETPVQESRAIPQPITKPKSQLQQKELLRASPEIEEEILQVAAQSAIVKETMDEINRINPNKIENALKKFQPAELFERLNQITFVLIEMNNRLTAIEASLEKGEQLEPVPVKTETLSPREQFEAAGQEDVSEKDLMDLDTAKEELKKITSAKKIPGIPNESYVDNGVSLEEVFPDRPDEAYKAAYSSMAETESDSGVSKSPQGGMTGIKF